jgi:hypothetical protein
VSRYNDTGLFSRDFLRSEHTVYFRGVRNLQRHSRLFAFENCREAPAKVVNRIEKLHDPRCIDADVYGL